MLIQPWIDRLRAQVPTFRAVAGAAELGAVKEGLVIAPSAYVIPAEESADNNRIIGGVSQRITAAMGVVISIRNVRDMRGQSAAEELGPIRDAVMTALLGWAPDTQYEPVTYRRGRLLSLDDQVLWWQDEFETAFYLRAI